MPNSTTWDEHLIELSFPKSASLGHIDFRFSMYQPCQNRPAIQVTLLKQNTSGFGYRKKSPGGAERSASEPAHESVDENVDSNVDWSDPNDNPVLTEEYLHSHNADIIAGPIEVASCMNLNNQGGVVSLTSPKLFKTKSRNFLIHIKTMIDVVKGEQGKVRGKLYTEFVFVEWRC